jgi:hypothetical protein
MLKMVRTGATWLWTRTCARILGLSPRPIAVFALSFGFLEIVETFFRRYAIGGLYFQRWPSEILMQSVSIRELASAPFESLWYLHIQPPATNLIRAFIVAFHREDTWADVMRGVDRDLYHAWALAGAALGALIDCWLRRLRVPGVLSALFTLSWLLYPANLAYATLLDGTLLSALLTTWILYATWSLGSVTGRSLGRLSDAVLLAYFTRSVFQWPFVVVMLATLALLRVSRRQLLAFGLVVGLTVGIYSFKQSVLFGTVSTSTFQGLNLTNSIGADCHAEVPAHVVSRVLPKVPVLTERFKLDGSVNFNHVDQLDIERGLMSCFRRDIGHRTLSSLWTAYSENFDIFSRPSSQYQENAIVDRLPWRAPLDWLFSGWRLISITLVAGSLGIWQARSRWRSTLALLLPALYVFAVAVLGDRGENMRFKFFLEPSLYVLVVVQSYRVARWMLAQAKELISRRRPAGRGVL